jgi:hypothetical protein
MGLNFAIDELYATGWAALDTSGCDYHADGRTFPRVERVRREFADAGFDLSIRHVQLFDCYRAEWHAGSGESSGGAVGGAVVGQAESEAAVYALAQLRRQCLAAATA